MQIVHIYKDYFPVLGGIENHVRMLAEAQAAAGHDVTVVACADGLRSRVERSHGVTLFKAGRIATLSSMPLSVSLPVAVGRLQADIVHMHFPFPLGEVSGLFLGRTHATVITYHSDIVRQRIALRVYAPLLRRILGATDRIIATSSRYLATSPWLMAVRERCTVIPLGVDLSRFRPRDRGFEGTGRILFVGRLRYYKGLETLLRALPDIPGARLSVVGDGPMRPAWQRRVGELDLGSRVEFHGEVPDSALAETYRAADLLVLPSNSRAEAFGTVLLEAMASGIPVVSTELGTGTSWVNIDGVTGRVVPPDDPDRLAGAIRDLLGNAVVRERMGKAARVRVEREFGQERMFRSIESAYVEVLGRKCPAYQRAAIHAGP